MRCDRPRARSAAGSSTAGEKGENSGAGGKIGDIVDASGGGEAGRVIGECGGGVMYRGVGWLEAAGDVAGDCCGEGERSGPDPASS